MIRPHGLFASAILVQIMVLVGLFVLGYYATTLMATYLWEQPKTRILLEEVHPDYSERKAIRDSVRAIIDGGLDEQDETSKP
jgi:hypothetical protein